MAAIAAAVLIAIACAAVWLAESSIRVRGERRGAPDSSTADAMARQLGARWENAAAVSHDGLDLRAWFFEPPANEWNGEALLLLHGYTDRSGGMADQIRFFLQLGYAVLAPDSRAHGASAGEVVSFGVMEARDVPRWGDWLCARAKVSSYAAYGQSMGASVALLAVEHDPRIRFVVAESSFTTFCDAAYERLADRARVPGWVAHTLFRVVGESAFQYTRLRYGFDLHQSNPLRAMAKIRVPVCLIHGLADTSIHPRHSRRLQAANPAVAELLEVPGARHTEPIVVDTAACAAHVLACAKKAGSRAVTSGSRAC